MCNNGNWLGSHQLHKITCNNINTDNNMQYMEYANHLKNIIMIITVDNGKLTRGSRIEPMIPRYRDRRPVTARLIPLGLQRYSLRRKPPRQTVVSLITHVVHVPEWNRTYHRNKYNNNNRVPTRHTTAICSRNTTTKNRKNRRPTGNDEKQ